MGTDAADVAGTVTNPRSFKVHQLLCTELKRLVDRVLRVFPDIEAARPRCSSGIQALCLLNKAIEKARLILQYCSESSKLYLALTGDTILSRCKKSRSLLEQSLCQLQDMVPVLLAAEISQIVDDLSVATFLLDPYEEGAGKVVRELLQKDSSTSDSTETSYVKLFQLATSMLKITSPKTILIEKRAIKALLDKVSESDPTKRKILTFFMYLFKKHESLIVVDQAEAVPSSFQRGSFNGQSAEVEPPRSRNGQYEMENNMLRRAVPPEDFRCPISSRLMYDPVVATSGITYERMWIQKWFDEGNLTCPKTGMKLMHYLLTPNVSLKDLILRWCAQNGVVIPDPHIQAETQRSWDISCTSIASFGSSMNDLYLPMDFSAVSLGSIDSSFGSDYPRTKVASGLGSVQNDCGFDKFQNYANIPETDLEYLSTLGELAWESRRKVVENVKNTLTCNDRACYSLTPDNFVEPLITFLRDASDNNDINAKRDGFQLLLTFTNKNRNGVPYLRKDAFDLLESFLDSEATKEDFAIIEILSGHAHCRPKIAASGALVSILGALDSQVRDTREQALNILYNLSSEDGLCLEIVSLECVPKLVPLITNNEDSTRNCLVIMKNLCNTEEGRASVTNTRGCIAAITEVLDSGSLEEQEHAVDILLLLCLQRVEYCHLVMDEGVIPPLVNLTQNGNDRAKAGAVELLRQLRDIRKEPERPVVDLDAARASGYTAQEKKPSRSSGFFGMKKISVFGKKR